MLWSSDVKVSHQIFWSTHAIDIRVTPGNPEPSSHNLRISPFTWLSLLSTELCKRTSTIIRDARLSLLLPSQQHCPRHHSLSYSPWPLLPSSCFFQYCPSRHMPTMSSLSPLASLLTFPTLSSPQSMDHLPTPLSTSSRRSSTPMPWPSTPPMAVVFLAT